MSEYDYDSRRGGGSDRTRYRDREPEYVSETTYIQRGTGRPSQDLVYRTREDSIEDIPRDFPPTAEYRRSRGGRDDYPPRRAAPRGSRYDDDDDYYSDYGASGAGYARTRGAPPRRRSDYYDDDYYSDDVGRPRRQERRKSTVEKTLEDLGLGGAVGAILGKSRSKSRSRRGGSDYDDDDYDRHSTRSKSQDTRRKWQQAAKAAVVTGVIEAVRSRKEPGGWTGAKGQRVATAALGAAGVDGLLDRDPDKHSKRHIIESVVGGLAANRLANGARDKSGSRGRSRSRSRSTGGGIRERSRSLFRSLSRGRMPSRGRSVDSRDSYSRSPDRKRSKSRGLKELVAAGGIAAAGKAIYDRVRSKSRGRARSASASSQDSYGEPRSRYGRRRS